MREHHRRIVDWLKAQGADSVHIDPGHTHPKIVFEWNGKPLSYVTAGTPSDTYHASANAIRDLRHMLGLVEGKKTVGERRVRRNRAANQSAKLTSFTQGKDWTQKLHSHPHRKATIEQRAEDAFKAFWIECMRSVGAKSVFDI